MKAETPKLPLNGREIFQLVEDDLGKVEEDLGSFANATLPLMRRINQHLHESGGKRLRPAVLLLCARACNYSGPASVRLGAVVELIHGATLVHDDIIDHAQVRRGRPSVNATWGNDATVLAGDWMYMTAFHLALQLQNFRILDVLIEVTRTMVEGELLQLEKNWVLDISEQDHLDVCSRKTACLFSACARLAAILARSEPRFEEAIAEYGRCLGLSFQLTDDLLDYTADEETLGKPVLKDLEEGKVTLPIIYLLERSNSADKTFLHEVVSKRDFSARNKRQIIELVKKYGTLEMLREKAGQFAFQASRCAGVLPDTIYREALIRIPELVIQRQN